MEKLQAIFRNLLKCKNPQELINEGTNSDLKKTLNVFDLIVIGIGERKTSYGGCNHNYYFFN